MKKTLLLLFMPALLAAQPVLLPHIGSNIPPQNTDPICIPPVYTGEMDTSGYDEGDLVNDFTLHKTNGDSVRLRDVLANGKPVLLVAGNYTCPIFRQKLNVLNSITSYYSGALQVYIIYGIEAHPIVDPSPYSGFVWVTSDNYSEGVLYEQPDTYGQRLEMVDSLLANYTVVPEILVDGPCNNWWLNYGPAPNNAYLIDTNGIVRAKHGWLHRAPDNMWCDIDSLLGTTSGNCITVGNNGSFSFTLSDIDSVAYGVPSDVLAVHGVLHNLSSTDNVEINLSKQFINIPADWSTALCGDICYAPTVNSTNVIIAPDDSLNFTFYFYTGLTADSGYVKVRFKNLNAPANTIHQRFFGVTSEPAGVTDTSEPMLKIFPNPSNGIMTISSSNKIAGSTYTLTDQLGRVVQSGTIQSNHTELLLADIPSGFYYLKLNSEIRSYKIIRN
jgi:hypothetical protein